MMCSGKISAYRSSGCRSHEYYLGLLIDQSGPPSFPGTTDFSVQSEPPKGNRCACFVCDGALYGSDASSKVVEKYSK